MNKKHIYPAPSKGVLNPAGIIYHILHPLSKLRGFRRRCEIEDLNLPIIQGEDVFNKKSLSMDEYLEFVEFNLKHTVDIKEARNLKNKLAVNAPFSIKE